MAGKKGMRMYPPKIRAEVVERHRKGESVNSLSKKYDISRYAIQTWCGLTPKKHNPPQRRGRPRKYPITKQKEMELEIRRLQMENTLLHSFLQAAGRR